MDDAPAKEKSIPQIEVTPEMVRAGLTEMREHSYAEDIEYVLECVYRAMAYEKPS